ncbi:hypothetical protein MUK42_11229 [Musa troglodytarum]|uniref:Uncharacterized protein n=1 Tax=Musa troglodytarum TaxID=320322 RepID=A0A9E7GPF0_9LILI|nr:hypothetical protein MUK42_11229 [Musa troglodytarum]URE15793.1 hypothetical protein MUK42_11229 [Musa troglodytarum]URE15794.1 hypothetical protein MUK42_11229 [Musa troglodytarum]
MASSHARLRSQPPRPRPSLGTLRRLPSPHRSVMISPSQSWIPSLHISVLQTRPCSRVRSSPANGTEEDPKRKAPQDEEVKNLGVRVALSMLKFYKREISPLMLSSCRFVPTCSEYSMVAYKKYGVVKGTILTAWRLCRCNPLGGTGFDPPRWFGEEESFEEH